MANRVADPARLAVEAYFAAWNEADQARRERLLESCWSPEGRFMDAHADVSGRDALSQWIEAALQASGGARLQGADEPRTIHGHVRFGWEASAAGRTFARGVNFGRLGLDGRFLWVVGYWDG